MEMLATAAVHNRSSNLHQMIAPRPRTVAETGLSPQFLAELLVKHLFHGGVMTVAQLAERSALAGSVLESVLDFLRREGRVEVPGRDDASGGLRYALTRKGHGSALDALMKSGYTGPAPVPLEQYVRVVKSQSVHKNAVSRESMQKEFANTVIREEKLNQLGPALTSGRAIFIYGPAGTGKSYITQRLVRLLRDHILIPHAISVNGAVVQLYDPQFHHACEVSEKSHNHILIQGYDPRFVLCRRPTVISGGELTLDMLDLNFNPANKEYQAPLQLKAANGMLIIDDLGRQRVAPMELFNRWIVPLEEKKDFLSFGSGRQFTVPFDTILVFSTNMNPLALADEAFLRRIGYKIHFDYLTGEEYSRIWEKECEKMGIEFDQAILDYVVTELHGSNRVPLLPCHPRDLINIALNVSSYLGLPNTLTIDLITHAWKTYFVELSAAN